ncbi:MAG: hypothetical protein IJC09_06225 [Clostridia bacterium]|nr:hypothetical protein [Clostridia bacterium]
MKEVLWILICSVGWIPGFAFGLWWEERRVRRKHLKQKKSKQRFMRSVKYAGQRLMQEDRIKSVLKEPVKVEAVKPIRKVCGVLASEEAQRILEG